MMYTVQQEEFQKIFHFEQNLSKIMNIQSMKKS